MVNYKHFCNYKAFENPMFTHSHRSACCTSVIQIRLGLVGRSMEFNRTTLLRVSEPAGPLCSAIVRLMGY